jgi:hypothetical protein
MMRAASIPENHRYRVFPDAVRTSVQLDALCLISLNRIEKTRHEHFFGNLPSYVKHLRTWGEAGKVKIRSSTDAKLKDASGMVCLMIGYANQNSGDTYRMYDPVTKNVYETRDIQWLGRI